MLAIEWTSKKIRVVQGQASGESVKLEAAFAVDLPESTDASNPEEVGAFVKSQLTKHGLKERRAVACIDRRNVVLKVVNVANIAESEISNTVRLQAMRDLTLPLEETTVDFVHTNPQSDFEEPQVVVAVVRNEIVTTYQRMFRAAGLKLEGLWPASLAHVRAAMSGIPTMITHAGEEHFLIVPSGDSVELSLLRGTRFLTSASRPVSRTQPGGSENDSFLQSLKRLQSSLSGQYTDLKVQSVLVSGPERDPEITSALTEQFGAEVVYFDPLKNVTAPDIDDDDRGSFAGVVGSLVVASRSPEQRINLLVPKKPKPKTDYRRAGVIVAVGLVVLLLLAGQQYVASKGSVLDKQIKAAQAKKVDRDKQLKSLKVKTDQLAWLEQWRERDANWLNILRDVVNATPEASKLFLTRMELKETPGVKGSKATIEVEGFADDSRTIFDLNNRLTQEQGLLVDPGPIQQAPRFPGYHWRYTAKISIPSDWTGGKKTGPLTSPPSNMSSREPLPEQTNSGSGNRSMREVGP